MATHAGGAFVNAYQDIPESIVGSARKASDILLKTRKFDANPISKFFFHRRIARL